LRGKLILRGNPGEGDYVKKIDLTLYSPSSFCSNSEHSDSNYGNLGTLPVLFLPLLFWSAALLWKEISLQNPLQFLYESFTAKRSAG
jgi:hypothetical protein